MISFERDVSFPRSVCAFVHKHAHYFYARGHKLGTNTRKNTRISFVRVGTNTRTLFLCVCAQSTLQKIRKAVKQCFL